MHQSYAVHHSLDLPQIWKRIIHRHLRNLEENTNHLQQHQPCVSKKMAQRSPASELRSHLFLQLINYFLKQIVIKIQVAQGSDGVTIPGSVQKTMRMCPLMTWLVVN